MTTRCTAILTCGILVLTLVACVSGPPPAVVPDLDPVDAGATSAESAPEPVAVQETNHEPSGELVGEWIATRGMQSGSAGGGITIEGSNQPSTFNPAAFLGEDGDEEILALLFAPLLDIHPHHGIAGPNLAARYQLSADGTTIDIDLRADLRWSDGVAITAIDAVYSLNALYLSPEVNGIGVEAAQSAGGVIVEETGERSLRITTGAPSRSLLDILAFPPMPRHVVEPWLQTHAPEEFVDFWASYDDLSTHVSSGPFMIRSFTGDTILKTNGREHRVSVLELERNAHFHRTDAAGRKLPYLDTVTILARPDPYMTPLLYWDGLVDVTYLPTAGPDNQLFGWPWPATIESARDAARTIPGEHYVVTDIFATAPYFITFNMQRAPGPAGGGLEPPLSDWFNDVRFRRAISALIPRGAIIDEFQAGRAAPFYSNVPPGWPAYSSTADLLVPRYDPPAAAALLAEMGLSDRDGDGILEDSTGNRIEFSLVTNQGNQYRVALAEFLAESFREAGILMKVEPLEWTPLLDVIYGATFEALLIGTDGSDSMGEGWNLWTSTGDLHLWDIGQAAPQREWEARLDELKAEYDRTVHREELFQIGAEADIILSTYLPLMTITRAYEYILTRRPFRNLQLTGDRRHLWPLEYVFIDE